MLECAGSWARARLSTHRMSCDPVISLTRVGVSETRRCPPDILCPARLRHSWHGHNAPLSTSPPPRRLGCVGVCGGSPRGGAAWALHERGRGRALLPLADDSAVDHTRSWPWWARAACLCRPSVRRAARRRHASTARPARGGSAMLGCLCGHTGREEPATGPSSTSRRSYSPSRRPSPSRPNGRSCPKWSSGCSRSPST